ncbi:aldo/keto reductase [Nonomuraea lactucae]|uniref:aldo/keto reductase n=1 Tax=Nonomuraea lactucae TaxID=2249762 RepID=UPI000DE3F2C0|nr:aldo/keto reductase [Nonomuraea lactucae]
MKYAQLGTTGVFVSRLSLGAMSFGGRGSQIWEMVGALEAKEADQLVGAALDRGVNLIDTADMYGDGASEEILGEVLGSRRRDVLLATKMTARVGPGPNDVGQSRLHVMRSLEDSLRRLRTDHIDLYQIHAFDPITPFEESLAALDDAVRQGKIRYIGASNLTAWQTMKALGVSERRGWARFCSLQAHYSLTARDIEREIIPMAGDQGLALLVWGPLAAGLLTGKFDRTGARDENARRAKYDFPPVDLERAHDVIDVLRRVATRHEATVAGVALAWLLTRPGVTSAVIGAKRPEQLEENLAATGLELTERDLAELDQASALPVEYPAWMQADESYRFPPGFRSEAG